MNKAEGESVNGVKGGVKIFDCPFLQKTEEPPKFGIGQLVTCDIADEDELTTENSHLFNAVAVCIVTGVKLAINHKFWVYELLYVCCVDISFGSHTLSREMICDDWFENPGECFWRPEDQIDLMSSGLLNSFLSMFPSIKEEEATRLIQQGFS